MGPRYLASVGERWRERKEFLEGLRFQHATETDNVTAYD